MNPKYKNTKNIAFSSDRQGTRPERHKYLFELMKHMTTLSSTLVAFVVTFLDKVLHDRAPHLFIMFIFGGFCISIIASLFTMLTLASVFGEKIPEEDKTFSTAVATIAIMGFFMGMAFLMIAAYRSH